MSNPSLPNPAESHPSGSRTGAATETTPGASKPVPSTTRKALMHAHTTPCVTAADVFQHPLVEDPASARAGDTQLEARRLVDQAVKLCSQCPGFDNCLYAAVVEHDVAGVAAGTTQAQRARIRRLVGLRVEPEDLGGFVGTAREGSRLSHTEVLRLRRANPDASLETIAEWLGCSLSTVKRHLRRARRETPVVKAALSPRPAMDAVLRAHGVVTGRAVRDRVA